LYIMLRIEN